MNERLKFRIPVFKNNEFDGFVDLCVGDKLPDLHGGRYGVCQQCTGMKDIKGKLIYEGDIVRQEGGMREQLIPVYWCGTAYNIPLSEFYNDGKVHEVFEFTYEIVGNKHQNRQLWYAIMGV